MNAPISRRKAGLIGAIALLLALSACAQQKAQSGLSRASVTIGSATIDVELALTETQRETGLMYRKSLADGKGMLFVFSEDSQLSFWMKNTRVPLSVAYISSDGIIQDIFDMEPFSEKSIVTTHYARFALEVPQGYFGKIGAKPGDKALLPAKY